MSVARLVLGYNWSETRKPLISKIADFVRAEGPSRLLYDIPECTFLTLDSESGPRRAFVADIVWYTVQ